MALRMIVDKTVGFAAKHYQKALATQLQQTGLRYEDIINEDEKEVKEALSLADPDVLVGRTRRLKRAIDLSFKRKNFMDYAPDVDQETFKFEFYDDVEKIKARDQEYALLNSHTK
eukprot:68634_1